MNTNAQKRARIIFSTRKKREKGGIMALTERQNEILKRLKDKKSASVQLAPESSQTRINPPASPVPKSLLLYIPFDSVVQKLHQTQAVQNLNAYG